jgi:hypothetical protein
MGAVPPNASANESEPISSNQSDTTAVQPGAFAAVMVLPSATTSAHLGFRQFLGPYFQSNGDVVAVEPVIQRVASGWSCKKSLTASLSVGGK